MVTGAGSGIGRALSLLLASKGLTVLAVGRREEVRFKGELQGIYIYIYMSCGQYSWLITIKNGASHPMVPLGIYNNHDFWILIMDGMTINHIVSIDHGSYRKSLLYMFYYI